MRLPRMTTRRWMVAVAVVAAALSIWEIARRKALYLSRSQSLEREYLLAYIKLVSAVYPPAGCVVEGNVDLDGPNLPVEFEGLRRRALHYRQMKLKYEKAARYPWLPVEPDPPPPEP